jgi:hypothetical protein
MFKNDLMFVATNFKKKGRKKNATQMSDVVYVLALVIVI